MEWIDIEQNTKEWLQLRAGRVTGSQLDKVMANHPKSFEQPAKRLARKIAAEQLIGRAAQENSYTNAHMERGHEQEETAKYLYFEQTGNILSNGGFYSIGDNIGVSPDGRDVENKGIGEIKCVIASTHFACIERGRLDPSYKWQVALELKAAYEVDGFEWLDFISYCADFPTGKQLFVSRITVYDEDVKKQFSMIDERMEKFSKEVVRLKGFG
jgi:hypothetical protein